MPYGDYGLVRNAWVDERFDPEKSTLAYARYIKELHEQFGDWYLAMAAYDWGAGKVQRAVQRTGYADFWELYQRNVLPAETKNYVPIILAAAIMAKNPTQYGLADAPHGSALAYGHGDHGFPHQFVSGGGHGRYHGGRNPEVKSQPAADEHSRRFLVRSASPRGNGAAV